MNENKTNINWEVGTKGKLWLNPYKIEISKKWDFASYNKKKKKN